MSDESTPAGSVQAVNSTAVGKEKTQQSQPTGWERFLPSWKTTDESSSLDSVVECKDGAPIEKWSLGILNDKRTEEVPGQCILWRFRGNHCFKRVCQVPCYSFRGTEMDPWVFDINPRGHPLRPCHLLFHPGRDSLPYIRVTPRRRKPQMDKYCWIHSRMNL